MPISPAAQPTPIVAPSGIPIVQTEDKTGELRPGVLSQTGRLLLQQSHDFVVSMARLIPAQA
jgi:hypothetical protein